MRNHIPNEHEDEYAMFNLLLIACIEKGLNVISLWNVCNWSFKLQTQSI